MNKRLICSSGTKEDLQEMINEFYYSKNYIITDEGTIFNTKLNKTIDNAKVEFKRKRWRFILL